MRVTVTDVMTIAKKKHWPYFLHRCTPYATETVLGVEWLVQDDVRYLHVAALLLKRIRVTLFRERFARTSARRGGAPDL